MSGMMSAMSMMPGGGAASSGGAGGGLWDFMQRMQDPMAVLQDPNASGLSKLAAFLSGSKFQMQGGGRSFGVAGPGSGSQGQLAALMRKIKMGMDQSPAMTPVDRPAMATGPNLPLGGMRMATGFDPANLGGFR